MQAGNFYLTFQADFLVHGTGAVEVKFDPLFFCLSADKKTESICFQHKKPFSPVTITSEKNQWEKKQSNWWKGW